MPVQKEFPPHHFDTVVRWIKQADSVRLEQISRSVNLTMGRLKLRPRLALALTGMPAGSDQFDGGSFVSWLASIEREDMAACSQLRAIHATVEARLKG